MAKRKIAAAIVAVAMAIAAPLLTQVEGRVNAVYLDTGNVPTVCEGHTGSDVQPGDVWSDDMCDEAKLADTKIAAAAVIRYVRVPLHEHEYAALISFVFNVGEGQFRSSTLLRKLNAEDYNGACNELTRWVYDNGKKLSGLVKRRVLERNLCLGEL